jgi:carbonic anhydrase
MMKASIYLLIFVIAIHTVSCNIGKGNKKEIGKDTISAKKLYTPPNVNTPDEAIAEIKAGNERYKNHRLVNTNITEMIEHTSDDQHPFVAVLGCIDSRVPAEFIFDQGIGNMFVARVAGNVEDPFILGSLEYATKVKGAKLIVVLGHNKCGAINGAIDGVELGNLTQLLKQIKPAIIPDSTGNKMRTSNNTGRRNVQLTMERIHKRSPVINDLIKEGKLKMIGAYYDVTSGKMYYEDDLNAWW